MARYGRWIESPEVSAPRLVNERDAVDLALAEGEWIGLAVLIYAAESWTVIEEVSGGLAIRSVDSWLQLAEGGDLVYAGYNDAIPYAQLLAIEQGRVRRQYLEDEQDPSEDLDVGRLPEEAPEEGNEPFTGWTDVMAWVEADEEKLGHPERGWLWIHRAT